MLCALSGRVMVLEVHHPDKASIDRKDSTLGYTPENIQLVTKTINVAKNQSTDSDFIRMCHAVAARNPITE